MRYGYASAPRRGRMTIDAQEPALRAAGCEVLLREAPYNGAARPQLKALLERLEARDEVIVCRLDRVARSLAELLPVLTRIDEAGAVFRSIQDTIDTSAPGASAMMKMLRSLSNFEREMMREKTMHGLAEARRVGRHIGRRPKLDPRQKAEIMSKIENGEGTPASLAMIFNVSKATVKRAIAEQRAEREAA